MRAHHSGNPGGMDERRNQMERDAWLNAVYQASSEKKTPGQAGFDYQKETVGSVSPPRAITQTELEMTARHINQPGGVQPFGAFILVQGGNASLKVIGCSSNLEEHLGVPSQEALGKSVTNLFEDEVALKKALDPDTNAGMRTIVATPKSLSGEAKKKVNLIIMQSVQGIAIDLEPADADPCPADDEAQVQISINKLNAAEGKEDMFRVLVQEIHRLAGYERVMCYAFHEDNHGEVVAEAVSRQDTRSYLHLHFPATDIPQRARELFMLNKARIIVDSSLQPSPLISAPDPAPGPHNVSLSTSTTRAVHPAHLEYLQNWGVKATLVLSVRANGKLWGLVCCNHESSTRYMSYKARMGCVQVVDTFSTRLSHQQSIENLAHMNKFESQSNILLKTAIEDKTFNLKDLVAGAKCTLINIINDTHGGAVVTKDGDVHTVGSVPKKESILALARWRFSDAGNSMPAVGCFAKVCPEAEDPGSDACGLLSMPLLNGGLVMWFRREEELETSWSGNPNESKTRIPGSTFMPQNSFETYVQTVRGNCKPWGSKNMALAAEFADKIDSVWADASDSCIFAVETSGRITLFNDKCAATVGMPKKEAVGTLISKICPMHGDSVIERLERISCNGPHDVYIVLRPDYLVSRSHKTVELLGCAQMLRDATGHRVSLFIGQKVNEGDARDPLASRLQEVGTGGGFEKVSDPYSLLPMLSQDPLEIPHQLSVLHKVRIPCWLMETDPHNHRFVWGNETACACFGKTIQEFVCMDLSNQRTISEQLGMHDWHQKVFKQRRMLVTRKTFFPDTNPVTFDLEVHPVETKFPGESEVKVLAFVVGMPVSMQDTGQIESGRSHEMLNQSRIMTMLFTMKGKLIQANVAARAHYFIESLSENGGLEVGTITLRNIFESCVWESEADMETCMADMFRTCAAALPFEIEVLKKHGFFRDATSVDHGQKSSDAVHLVQCFFARDPLTGERCVLINETDISRMKGVQVDLIMSKRKQEQFLASVSHELRTPLNGILGLSQSLFADPEATEKMKKTLRIIMSSGHRLSSLVNDILDATSMKESRFVLNFQEVSFKEVADHVVYAIMPMVQRQVKLINDVPSDLPTFQGDAGRLLQVLTNLLGNSIKFTHSGHIRVTATCSQNNLTFSVEDTGIGIAVQKQKEIFDPFVKGDMSTTWNYCGSGLGLSVVKSLVEAFAGVISLKSSTEPHDHGTTFTVNLPLEGPKTSRQEEAFLKLTDGSDSLDEASELSGARLERLIAGQLGNNGSMSPDERKKFDLLQLHKSEVDDVSASKPEVGGLSCLLLCQIGCLSSEAPDQAVGSFVRALMDFQHLLDSSLEKHGARLATSSEEHHIIIGKAEMSKQEQLSALYQVAKDLLKGTRHIFFQWPHGQEAVDEIQVEIRMGLCCGPVTEGVIHDDAVCVHGRGVEECWELVHSAPSMQVHFSERAVDELKMLDANLAFVQNQRATDEKTGAKVPSRCYLERSGNSAAHSDPLNIGHPDITWSRDIHMIEETYRTAVNFALGLNPGQDSSTSDADFQTALSVLKKYTHLNVLLSHHMSAHLLARSNHQQTMENEDAPHEVRQMSNAAVVPDATTLKISLSQSGVASTLCHYDIYGKIEIMSVDDDPINQMVIENLFQPYGYVLTICMDGLQCLELIESRGYTPDLVLLDVMMPHLSGYEVCERLRAKYGTTSLPILMISAKVDHESIVKCFKSGGNDFVHKPFNREELLARIKMQLDMKKMWQIQVEHQLSVNMLRTMMPDHVIDRLQKGEQPIVDHLDSVTILFANIVSYTDITCRLHTHALVNMLNSLFTAFDCLCDEHNVTKVETIGDSFMVVAHDDPEHVLGHADRMAGMAIGMMAAARDTIVPGLTEHVEIRIAMHSGPVLAGVLGERMLRYSYIGETVNEASMLEQNGYPMNVVMSDETRELLTQYDCEDLGVTMVKGKGGLQMWLLKHDLVDWEMAMASAAQRKKSAAAGGGGALMWTKDGSNPEDGSPERSSKGDGSGSPIPAFSKIRAKSRSPSQRQPRYNSNAHPPPLSDRPVSPPRSNGVPMHPDPDFSPADSSVLYGVRPPTQANGRSDTYDEPPPNVLESKDAEIADLKERCNSLLSSLSSARAEAEAAAHANTMPPPASMRPVAVAPASPNVARPMAVAAAPSSVSVYDSHGGAESLANYQPKSEIAEFLTRIGMGSKAAIFEDMGITPDLIENLADVDLIRVGISSLGEQLKIKKTAKIWVSAVNSGLIPIH